MTGHKLRRPPGRSSRSGSGFLCGLCALFCSRLCFFGIPAFQFPFLLHTGKRIAGKLRVLGGHLLKIHIGPGFYVLPFPLCHLPGRVFLPAAFGIPGQFPGSGLGHKFRLMGSFHTHIFMLDFVDLVVDIEPCFCTGSPDCLFCKPRRFLRCPFCLGLVQFLPSLSQLFPGVFRFCLCFLVLVLFAPGILCGALRLLCLAGILRPARFILLPHAVRGTAFAAVLLKLAAFGLRAIVARRAVLPGILVLKPQASGWCRGRPFPFRRSGAIAPGILRRPRPLKTPFVRFLSDDVSLLSKPRASMARSVLCPVHFLFFVLRAGGHNGVQLGVLREAVNKRDGGVPEEQQPFAGIGMGHIGKLVGADPKLFG